eukprot:6204453-Pleurochrysis_carterae.AAC.1
MRQGTIWTIVQIGEDRVAVCRFFPFLVTASYIQTRPTDRGRPSCFSLPEACSIFILKSYLRNDPSELDKIMTVRLNGEMYCRSAHRCQINVTPDRAPNTHLVSNRTYW